MNIRISKGNLVQTLNLLYSIFNKLLFSDTLPSVPVKIRASSGYHGWMDFDPKTKKPLEIVIDSESVDPVKTLVHEMTHIYHLFIVRKGLSLPSSSYHPPSFVRLLESRYKKLGYELDSQDVL